MESQSTSVPVAPSTVTGTLTQPTAAASAQPLQATSGPGPSSAGSGAGTLPAPGAGTAAPAAASAGSSIARPPPVTAPWPAHVAALISTLAAPSKHAPFDEKRAGVKPYMSGKLVWDAAGKPSMVGQWSMVQGDVVTSPFQYEGDKAMLERPTTPEEWAQHSGVIFTVSGNFKLAAPTQTLTILEKENVVALGGPVPVDAPKPPESAGVVAGLRGAGRNGYGDFQLRGWFSPASGDMAMVRLYSMMRASNRPNKKGEVMPPKHKTAAPRRSPSPGEFSPAPRSQRRRSAPKRLSEPIGFSSDMTAEIRACFNVLESMSKSKQAFLFAEPVDPEALNIPDYFTIVKHPMDYGTVKDKIKRGDYKGPEDFERDMELIFSNAILYNPVNTPTRSAAEQEQAVFRRKMAELKEQWAEKARKAKAAADAKSRKRERAAREEEAAAQASAKKARGDGFPGHGGSMPGSVGGTFASAPLAGAFPSSIPQAAAGSMDPQQMAMMMAMMSSVGGNGPPDPSQLATMFSTFQAMVAGNNGAATPTTPAAAHAPQPQPGKVLSNKPLSMREQQELANDVGQLNDSQMEEVVRLVRQRMQVPESGEIELDMASMDTDTLRALQQYVNPCVGKAVPYVDAPKKRAPRKRQRTPAKKSTSSGSSRRSSAPAPAPKRAAAQLPPPKAAALQPTPAAQPFSSESSMSQYATALGIPAGAHSAPAPVPAAETGAGLAAAMDDALDLAPTPAPAAPAPAPAPAPAADTFEPDEFRFDMDGWDDATDAAGTAQAGTAALDQTLFSKLEQRTAADATIKAEDEARAARIREAEAARAVAAPSAPAPTVADAPAAASAAADTQAAVDSRRQHLIQQSAAAAAAAPAATSAGTGFAMDAGDITDDDEWNGL